MKGTAAYRTAGPSFRIPPGRRGWLGGGGRGLYRAGKKERITEEDCEVVETHRDGHGTWNRENSTGTVIKNIQGRALEHRE